MQPHELRVHAEAIALADNCLKLRDFVGGVKFLNLEATDQALLRAQLAAMQAYSVILEMRIARFKVEP